MKTSCHQKPVPNVSMPSPASLLQRKCACGRDSGPDGECAGCQNKRLSVQRKEALVSAPPIVHEVLNSRGRPLDREVRSFMEPRFGHDFGAVRVHTDSRAAESAQLVNAQAYTIGRNIVFGDGQFAPQKGRGMGLLAHELTHVVQQGGRDSSSVQTFRLADARAVHEDAADRAAEKIVSGKTVSSSSFLPAPAGLLQRAERGTYVSTIGEAPYLDAAFEFYRGWGYSNVRRVSTMREVLDDLDRNQAPIDTFRIVAHGPRGGAELAIGLMSELESSGFSSDTVRFTTEQAFRERFGVINVIEPSLFKSLLGILRRDTKTGPLLTSISVGGDTPEPHTPLGIVLRAILENLYLADVRTSAGEALQIPPALLTFVTSRLSTYRPLVEGSVSGKQAETVRQTIDQLIAEAPGALLRVAWRFSSMDQDDMDSLAATVTENLGARDPLRRDLSVSIAEGATGPYLRKLRSVRNKTDSRTHIEIRGCNIGTNPVLMDSLRNFFGRPKNLPSLSAPDLYQYFFGLLFRSVNDEQAIVNLWASGTAQEFDDWSRIRKREMVRVVNDTTLAALASRYKLNAARLRKFNPEIDPDTLQPGMVIWLVARPPIPRQGMSLEDFSARYLGDRKRLPALLEANPEAKNQQRLPAQLWLVPPELRSPLASAPQTLNDFRASLRRGEGFVGLDSSGAQPQIFLDNAQRARAIGKWLEGQRFDPRGRTAAALTALYTGERFKSAAENTYVSFLAPTFPHIEDPIFQDDPRYRHHIIRRPEAS